MWGQAEENDHREDVFVFLYLHMLQIATAHLQTAVCTHAVQTDRQTEPFKYHLLYTRPDQTEPFKGQFGYCEP